MKLKKFLLMAAYLLIGIVIAKEATAFDKAGVTGTTSAGRADTGVNRM
jgi:hypothetical protein